MLKAMKKAMVVAAVAAVSVAAPAVASADQWSANGVTVGGAPGVEVTGSGSLGFSVNIGVNVKFTCDVQVTADLFNQSGVARGQVTSFGVASPQTNCTVVGVSNCQVSSVIAIGTPWTIGTAGTNATITGVNFLYTYDRINPANPCALQGTRNVTGSVTAAWSNSLGWLTFANATGLLVNGTQPMSVDGELEVVGSGGQTIALS